eukprot:TRINITY_DN3538_c0_g1_i2.p1 TRINITY_DN3538_c0_g1~~TRINITY_DN3538_c0_g1_i2.p1  ORF type:complete len:269 (-),score=51.50 TRINITY_DN3538_c0_g1_i2:143-949(-)
MQKLPALTTLGLYACYHITNATVCELPQHCRALTALSFGHCQYLTDIAAKVIASLQNLVELDISYCTGISNEGVLLLTLSLHQLKMFYMEGLVQVTTDTLTHIGQNCQRVERLNMSDCGGAVDDTVVLAVGKGCPQLQEVATANGHVTDHALGQLSLSCSKLTVLNVKRCCSLTDYSIVQVAERCTGLRSLELDGLPITNRSLLKIAHCCPSLTSIGVSFCRKITTEALEMLVKSCTQLKQLSLYGCSQISLAALRLKNPQLILKPAC